MLVATHAAKTKATVESFILGDMYLLPFLAQSAGALWNTRRRPQSVHNPLITSPEQRRLLGSKTAVKCDALFLFQLGRQAVSAMHPRKPSILWPCLSRSASSPILLPSVLTQAISGLFVAQPTGIPSATTTTQTKVCRRRLFMRYPQLQAFVVSGTAPGKLPNTHGDSDPWQWPRYRYAHDAIAGEPPPLPSYFNIQRGNPDLAVPRMKSSISS